MKMYLGGAYTNFSRFRGGGYVTAPNSNFVWGGGGPGRGGTTGSKGQQIIFSLLTLGMVFSRSLGDF